MNQNGYCDECGGQLGVDCPGTHYHNLPVGLKIILLVVLLVVAAIWIIF